MPANHQHMLEARGYDGSDFLHEAEQVGRCAMEVVERMIRKAHYVQHTYALWQAFRRLKRNYGKDRLEAACRRLHDLEQVTCRALENVLKKGLDHQQAFEQLPPPVIHHENLRGPQAY